MMRADGSIDWDRWQELPILTRSQAQDNFAALCARSVPPVAGAATEDTSSGSTGPAPPAFDDRYPGPRLRLRQRAVLRMARHRSRIAHGAHPCRPRSGSGLSEGTADDRVAGRTRDQRGDRLVDRDAGGSPDRMAGARPAPVPRLLPEQPARDCPRGTRAGIALHFDAIMTFGEMTSDDMRDAVEEYFACRCWIATAPAKSARSPPPVPIR